MRMPQIPTQTPKHQQGIALLTVLLLVVIITVMAGSMLASQRIAIRQSGLTFEQNQLIHDLNAGGEFAIEILHKDNQLNQTDSQQDIWAKPIPPYPLGNHIITLNIKDESARFNINNLYHNGATDENALVYFQRLLTQLNLNPELAVAILDWQDPDDIVYQDGAEENLIYSPTQSNSPMPLNQPFISIEQLAQVKGITPEILAKLRPYITAVPYYLPININTAEPILLSALLDNGTPEQMQNLSQSWQNRPIENIDDLWQTPIFANLTSEQQQKIAPLIDTQSQAFKALASASDLDKQHQMYATFLFKKQANSGNNTPAEASKNNTNGRQENIQMVSKRLWAFRPAF